ncbi:MAG: cadherin-like domain-containing protein [Akkermansiaceae bacterium]|nr:cadherin-like domain-containing protein [Akkermansiaceae bacterium]
MVKDIFPGGTAAGSNPAGYCEMGGYVFFSATTVTHGTELWKSDGTPTGTVMLKDLLPGTASGSPGYFTAVESSLFFVASDGTYYRNLWKTDGTAEGTVKLGAFNDASLLTCVGGQLFFNAGGLWKSDGTVEGTTLVRSDVSLTNSLSSSGQGSNIVLLDGIMYFAGRNATSGTELWRSDGTSEGTFIVKDITPGQNASFPKSLSVVGSRIFFICNGGKTLWKSDGTPNGTVLVKEFPSTVSTASFHNLIATESLLYASASDGTTGHELWISDGTPEGTTLLKDINPGAAASSPGSFAAVGDQLYFSATTNLNGAELWKSDGTPDGTMMVRDIASGSSGSSPLFLSAMGSVVYFICASDAKLWRSDGTEDGTRIVRNTGLGYPNGGETRTMMATKTRLFLNGNVGTGFEPWTSDGTAEGTHLLRDINPGANSGNVTFLGSLGGKVLLAANDGRSGRELWTSDGTPRGTMMLKDIQNGESGSIALPSPPILLTETHLYFAASGGGSLVELWKTDGTAAGTLMVKDIRPGGLASNPRDLTRLGSLVIFSADNGTNGTELWKSDGTEAGTVLLKDLNPGSAPSYPAALAVIGSTLYFSADDGTNGRELWKTDGTTAGTVMVRNISPGSGASNPTLLATVGSTLFLACTTSSGTELWKSNGTSAGTVIVRDVNSGSASSSPSYVATIGSTIYFTATTAANGNELWKSDGTSAGTTMVVDVYPGNQSSVISDPFLKDGIIYFTALKGPNDWQFWRSDGTGVGTFPLTSIPTDEPGEYSARARTPASLGPYVIFTNEDRNGRELWRTDGTPGGTRMIKDVNPGPATSTPEYTPQQFAVLGSLAYIIADDGVNGAELWQTDGTEAGTRMVHDITGDSGSSRPLDLTVIGQKLYFTAMTEREGREWYVYDPAAPAPPALVNGGVAATGRFTANAEGSVNPHGSASLAYIEYGVNQPWEHSAEIQLAPDNASSATPFSLPLTGLLPGRTYHYRLTANNEGGASTTTVGSFTTDPNLPPVSTGGLLGTHYQTGLSLSAGTAALGISDPEGDPVTIAETGASSAMGGSIALNSGNLTYQPKAGFSGADQFPITVRDSHGATSAFQVMVEVSGPFGFNPRPAEISTLGGGPKKVRFSAIPARPYKIQRSVDLIFWEDVETSTPDAEGLLDFTDPEPPQPKAFYRLKHP